MKKQNKRTKKPTKLFYQLDGVYRNWLGLVGCKGADGLMDMDQCQLIITDTTHYELYTATYVVTVQSTVITRERIICQL